MKSILVKLLGGILALSTGFAYGNDPDVSISPNIGYFPLVTLGSSSGAIPFEVRNNHASNNLSISTVSLQGLHASEFAIDTDACGSQTLNPDNSCFIYVRYEPTAFGSKTARLEVNSDATNTPKLVAFLSNDEGDQNQVERRLPPVIFNLTIPEVMNSASGYNLQWSILGYHGDYESVVAIFDCDGVVAGDCGLNFGDNIANSGLITPGSQTPQPGWTFNGIPATEHQFEYNFQPDLHYSKASGTYPIVIRFYAKSPMDATLGEPSLSVVIPGDLSDTYYDDEGRRIQKMVTFP